MYYNLFSTKILLIFWLSLGSLALYAQSPEEIKADPEQYIWGEGEGPTRKKADDEALMMLISQISSRVEGSFEMIQTEADKNYKEKVQSIVKTYSTATLKNTKIIVESEEPTAKVLRFMKRSEIASIFEDRKNKILSFVAFGNSSLKELQIADALKYYYWSLTLLKSHPDGAKIMAQDGSLMSVWLYDQISSIFDDLSAEVVDLTKGNGFTTAELNITYKKSPVSNYDFTYFDGKNSSGVCVAKDGLASAELAGNLKELKTLRLKSEYVFGNEANFDTELKEVLQNFDPVPFRNQIITAKYKYRPPLVAEEVPPPAHPPVVVAPKVVVQPEVAQEQKKEIVADSVQVQKIDNQQTTQQPVKAETHSAATLKTDSESSITQVLDKSRYESSIVAIKKAITSGRYEDVNTLFTPQGFDFFQKLVQYGRAKILRDQPLKFVQQGHEVFCRSIPMSFSFKNNNKQFVEELVFRFDSTKRIDELSFALGQRAISDIMAKTVWSEKVRVQIIDFMESYKTAYALKRLDYIQKIFSDDALIIIGTYLKEKVGEPNPYKNNKVLKYCRLDKQTYINKLKQSFGSNEFINLKFEDNEVRKSGKGGEVYGIQIRQSFNSANYSDFGYLFLMMDFNNPNAPTIHVRTWQPEKNKDGSIYGLNDFN